MGYLAAKDFGYISVNSRNGLYYGSNLSPDGITNPATNSGIVNLKGYTFGYDAGNSIDDSPNISANRPRISSGSVIATKFTLSCQYSRHNDDRTVSQISSEVDTLYYLLKWARNRSIIMLFYMPNSTAVSWLNHGQEIDFYTSQLRSMYDCIWGGGFGTTTYGNVRFTTGYTMVGAISYDACAIPVVFDNVKVEEVAGTYLVKVEVTGFIMENEGRE